VLVPHIELLKSRYDEDCLSALRSFSTFLDEVKEFIVKNLKPCLSEKAKQILFRKSHNQTIADFNRRLDQHRDDLHFGITIDKELQRSEDLLDLRAGLEYMIEMLSEAKAEELVSLMHLTFVFDFHLKSFICSEKCQYNGSY
jgi:hypothetical protein